MVVDRALRHPAQRVHDVLNRRLLIALFQKEALGGGENLLHRPLRVLVSRHAGPFLKIHTYGMYVL